MSETNNNDLNDFFGTAKQGGEAQWKNHALSETAPNVFRIAPPVKSLKSSGRWSQYDSLHYGYTIPNEQNPDKPRHKPFRCVFKKNRANGMTEQDCPECNLLQSKENEVEALKAQQVASGKTPDEAEEFVKGARRLLREHNLDKKHYVLAKNLAGEWGVLKIPHRAKQALDKVIDDYMKGNGGEHPLHPVNGVWFRFTRKGKGLQTEYYVDIENESLGRGQFKYKSGELTSADVEGITKAPDLATLNDNKNLTYDQILALVRSNGEPTVVAQVFGTSSKAAPRSEAAKAAASLPDLEQAVSAKAAPAPAPVYEKAVYEKAAVSQADVIAALQAQLAAAMAATGAPAPAPMQVSDPSSPKAMAAPVSASSAPAGDQPSFSDLMKLDPQAFLTRFPDPNKK